MGLPVKLLVAAYDNLHAMVIFESKRDDRSILLDEMMISQPQSNGLWVFEGMLTIRGVGKHSVYSGTWRRPTSSEALAAASGDDPLLEKREE